MVVSAVIVVAHHASAPAQSAFTDHMEYRGFVVNLSAIHDSPDRDSLAAAIRAQFDLVANAPVKRGIERFFRTIPFVVDSAAFADPQYRGSFAGYCDGPRCPLPHKGGRIKIVPRRFAPEKAIFLHELLHAYHDHRLPKGFDNPDVERLYAAARASHVWGDSSYPMRNRQEYFASLGEFFFYGRAGRDGVVTRDTIKARQPALYEYYVKVFGTQQ